MTVWVFRDGRLVDKASVGGPRRDVSDFPTPGVSRMEAYESPVTGKSISSWRQRDADMNAAGAYDPRDMPASTRGRAQPRDEIDARRPDDTFQWRDPD